MVKTVLCVTNGDNERKGSCQAVNFEDGGKTKWKCISVQQQIQTSLDREQRAHMHFVIFYVDSVSPR